MSSSIEPLMSVYLYSRQRSISAAAFCKSRDDLFLCFGATFHKPAAQFLQIRRHDEDIRERIEDEGIAA